MICGALVFLGLCNPSMLGGSGTYIGVASPGGAVVRLGFPGVRMCV